MPAARACGTLPVRTGRPRTAIRPPSGARSPARVSPIAVFPLAVAPASPTTSPARTVRSSGAKCPSSGQPFGPQHRLPRRPGTPPAAAAAPAPSASPVIAATSASLASPATGAVSTCRASRKTVTVSHSSWTSWRWCEMNRKATPWARSARSLPKSRSMPPASSRAVGSSRMISRAPKDSARAISTNCRCSTPRSLIRAAGSTSTPYSASSSRARSRSARQRMVRSPWKRFR